MVFYTLTAVSFVILIPWTKVIYDQLQIIKANKPDDFEFNKVSDLKISIGVAFSYFVLSKLVEYLLTPFYKSICNEQVDLDK